jgi:hypothetical protein
VNSRQALTGVLLVSKISKLISEQNKLERQIQRNHPGVLTPHEQYEMYASAAVAAALEVNDFGDRYQKFWDVMDNYLASSEWKISGTAYFLLQFGSTLVLQNTGDIDNTLAAIIQPENTSQLFIATTSLQNSIQNREGTVLKPATGNRKRTSIPKYSKEQAHEIARRIQSDGFGNLSAWEQYRSYLVSASDAADGKATDSERVAAFVDIMDAYLQNSPWNISGTMYCYFSVETGDGGYGGNSGDRDNILWGWDIESGTFNNYFATSGLQVL